MLKCNAGMEYKRKLKKKPKNQVYSILNVSSPPIAIRIPYLLRGNCLISDRPDNLAHEPVQWLGEASSTSCQPLKTQAAPSCSFSLHCDNRCFTAARGVVLGDF